MKNLIPSVLLLAIISLPAAAQEPPVQSPSATDAVTPVSSSSSTDLDAVDPPPASGMLADLPPVEQEAVVMTPIEKEINEQLAYLRPTVNIDAMSSLFFSIWEHDLVRDARRGLNTRGNSEDGVDIVAPRDISLGGIVYAGKSDWTIWINNVRISPTRMPTEVMDLKVFRDYIELEWFDATTNQIFPIRLRPHQRFNLDSRIFLPG